MTVTRAIAYGTLVVGALDALDAVVFFGLRGVAPHRIFQSIAAGLLGQAAYTGGPATVALGAALHFFIAFLIVATFVGASRYPPVLTRAPILSGLVYGVGVYLVMNLVVLPLSAAASRSSIPWPILLNGVLIHMVGVGLPSSLFARAAS